MHGIVGGYFVLASKTNRHVTRFGTRCPMLYRHIPIHLLHEEEDKVVFTLIEILTHRHRGIHIHCSPYTLNTLTQSNVMPPDTIIAIFTRYQSEDTGISLGHTLCS